MMPSENGQSGSLIDPHMRTKLWFCGECEQAASTDAWNAAWWRERSRRMVDPNWNDDDYGKDWGLDERMVCPRCDRVHCDDETSYVDEVDAVVVPLGEPSRDA